MPDPDAATEIGRLPIVEEVARIRRRRRVSGHVQVAITTAVEDTAVQAVLHHRDAEVERVPIGREVSAPPPIRREGDTLVVPVLEERVELVRRLVLTEEIRFRFRTQEQPVSLPVRLRRQGVAVRRQPVPDTGAGDPIQERPLQMTHKLIAMFDSRAAAERAAEALRGLNVRASGVAVQDGVGDTALAGVAWIPEEDRATYHEGLRRGSALVTADIEEADMPLAMEAMEAAGAIDLDQRETEWRSQGWTGGMGQPDGTPGNPPGTMASRAVDQVAGTNISGAHPENEASRHGAGRTATAGAATTGAMTGREEKIPLAEERLRVGKRVAQAGRVRVRSYVVETPVEEQVRLREEHVRVERHAADRPVTGTEAELFRDRVIEAEESREEAVVSKEARVTGEVVVSKDATERTETVRDTVRRTEVEVNEDDVANDKRRRPGKGAA
jgi:uncharacterized protein (TIGR02271 family)